MPQKVEVTGCSHSYQPKKWTPAQQCCGVILLVVAGVMTSVGILLLGLGASSYSDAQSSEYTPTTCELVKSENWPKSCSKHKQKSGSGGSQSQSCTYSCDYVVTSETTGTAQYTLEGEGGPARNDCPAFGTSTTKPCYKKDDGKAQYGSTTLTFASQDQELTGSLVMMIAGAVVASCSVGCCACTVLGMVRSRNTVVGPPPVVVGSTP